MEGAIFLGEAVTSPHYRLYNLGSYPGLVEDTDGLSIHGELYAVTNECLRRLDLEEGVEEGLYERRDIELLPPHEQVTTEAYFYLPSLENAVDIGTRWNITQSI